MAEHNELYQRASYYDVIFNRDVGRELEFVSALYERLNGRPLQAVLDLACGPGYHARGFAARGVRAYGLDLRPEMIAFAREHAPPGLDNLSWIVGDMRAFTLAEPVDAAFTMFDSIDCLLTNSDLIEHLRAVAANLRPGGIYLIDLTHPRDCSPFHYGDFCYEGERDGCHVRIDWATNQPIIDPQAQTSLVQVTMRVNDRGHELVFSDLAYERFLFAQEIEALARLSGVFAVRAWHGDFDLGQPFDNSPASRRMIAVLQKRPDANRHSSYVSPKLALRPSPLAGTGLFAAEPLAPGELLAIWGGAVVSTDELLRLSERERFHSLQVAEEFHLAPGPATEPADFVNHSCAPNAGIQGQISLVALRPIAAGEEICYDYATTDSYRGLEFGCNCGAPACRKQISGDDWRRPELQARYAGAFSSYLQQLIAPTEATRRS